MFWQTVYAVMRIRYCLTVIDERVVTLEHEISVIVSYDDEQFGRVGCFQLNFTNSHDAILLVVTTFLRFTLSNTSTLTHEMSCQT